MLAIDSTVVSNDFRLGYLSLDSNERSQFQARELKSVPWPTGLQVVVGHWGYDIIRAYSRANPFKSVHPASLIKPRYMWMLWPQNKYYTDRFMPCILRRKGIPLAL